MGSEHAPETVWRAQELYCVDRKPFALVARELGIADSTVRRWADKFNWRAEREAIARAESEIRAKTVKARAHVLEKLLTAENSRETSQVAFAVASLERLALETAKCEREKAERAAPPLPVVSRSALEPEEQAALLPAGISDEERVALLEEAVNRQIAYVLANPVADLARRVKDIKAALDVLAVLRGKDDKVGGIVVTFEE